MPPPASQVSGKDTCLLRWKDEVMSFFTKPVPLPSLFPWKWQPELGPLAPLLSPSRNNETKIHTKLLSLYSSIYTFSCSQI